MPQKIIAIDDDKIVLSLVKDTLSGSGYDVKTFSNPVEGAKAIKAEQPDAVLLDRVMPEMDGNDIISALQVDDYTRDIPILMLTALNEISDITASLGLGARDYIVKPFDNDNLLIRVKKVLSER